VESTTPQNKTENFGELAHFYKNIFRCESMAKGEMFGEKKNRVKNLMRL
jgi:hypothetical protein